MAMVLCTGWDKGLLDTRALILQSAGHEVRQARTQNELVSACEKHQFDVVVIGQNGFSQDEAAHMLPRQTTLP